MVTCKNIIKRMAHPVPYKKPTLQTARRMRLIARLYLLLGNWQHGTIRTRSGKSRQSHWQTGASLEHSSNLLLNYKNGDTSILLSIQPH